MSCERCDRLDDRIDYLEKKLRDTEKSFYAANREKEEVERENRRLQSYEEKAKRDYDHYVTTPKGMP